MNVLRLRVTRTTIFFLLCSASVFPSAAHLQGAEQASPAGPPPVILPEDIVGFLGLFCFLVLLGVLALTVAGLVQILKATSAKRTGSLPGPVAFLIWQRKFRISRILKECGAVFLIFSLFLQGFVLWHYFVFVLKGAAAPGVQSGQWGLIAEAALSLTPANLAAVVGFIAYFSGYAISSILHFAGASRTQAPQKHAPFLSHESFMNEQKDWNLPLTGIIFGSAGSLYLVWILISLLLVRMHKFPAATDPAPETVAFNFQHAVKNMGSTAQISFLVLLSAIVLLLVLGIIKSQKLYRRIFFSQEPLDDTLVLARRIYVIPHILQAAGLLILVFMVHRMLFNQIMLLRQLKQPDGMPEWSDMVSQLDILMLTIVLWAICSFIAFVTSYLLKIKMDYIVTRKKMIELKSS